MAELTPQKLLDLADEHPAHGMYPGTWNHDVVAALRSAAEEVDRLQALAGMDAKALGVFAKQGDKEEVRLRALIENAPHANECRRSLHEYFGGAPKETVRCTCWKAGVL